MKLQHPFEWLSRSSRKPAFVLLLILTLTVMSALIYFDTHLKTEAAPNGILSYEFAGTLPVAQSMIKSWGEDGRVYAGLSMGLDYLFLIVYAFTIGLGCVLISEKLSKKFRSAGIIASTLAWGLIIAGLLDAIENYALIKILVGSVEEFWLTIAWFSAAPKFALVGLGLIYVILGSILTFFIKE